MGIKISDMTAVANATGSELLPASVSDAPRRVSVEQVKDYTLAATAAISAASAVSPGNGVFILQGGAVKPVDIDKVTQRAIDIVWGKSAEVSPADAHTVPLKAGANERTMTLAVLSTFIKNAIKTGVLDVSTLDARGTVASTDHMLVVDGTNARRTTVSAINDAIYTGLIAHVWGRTLAESVADDDVIYLVRDGGGEARKVKISTLKAGMANAAVAPPTTTENHVPQWSATQKALKNGMPVRITVRESEAIDQALVSEKAVQDSFVRKYAEGIENVVIDAVIGLGAIAGVTVATVPAGAIIRSVQSNITTEAVAGGTSVKVGLGTDGGAPDDYGLSGNLLQNTKTGMLVDPAVLWTETVIKAYPCATGGGVGDSEFTAGAVRVRVVYEKLNVLASV